MYKETLDGWSHIIDALQKTALENGFHIAQIKEKFGELRFYCGGPYWFQDFIDACTEVSKHICEVCGKEGKTYNDYGWLRTRCESCHDKFLEEHNGKDQG